MKKLCKATLSVMLAVSTVTITDVFQPVPIVAKTIDNFTYVVTSDNTVKITNYGGSEEVLEIPSELDGKKVTAIGYSAFAECRNLTKVVIPETVTTIENYAFSYCTALKEVELTDEIVSLGNYVFKGCKDLVKINIPNQLTSLPSGLFMGCSSLEEITLPEGLIAITDNVFTHCNSLQSIELPESITEIGMSAFSGCIQLERVVLPESVKTLGTSAFSDCISLREVSLPSKISQVGQSAFLNCISLKEISFPDTIKSLGYSVLSGCSSLEKIKLPASLDAIPVAAFSGCTSLQSIDIPESVTTIEESAFTACINLKDIKLPNKLSTLGSKVFSYCNSLETINLPTSLREIPEDAFRYCENLRYIKLPNSITKINSNAFGDCPSLESVFIPKSVNEIVISAFRNSTNVLFNVFKDSAGYTYATSNNLPWKLIESKLNLDVNELTLRIDETRQLIAMTDDYKTIEPKNLTWRSENESVATVEDGLVTAKTEGETTIVAQTAEGVEARCKIVVDATEKPITSINLSKTEIKMNIYTSEALSATINPNETTDSKQIEWSSSDPQIVSVNATGKITAKAPGKATVTAKAANGMTANCEVTVESPITNLKMNQGQLTLDISSQSYQLRVTIEPVDTTDDKTIEWTSSKESVAIVDQNGNVTPKGIGYTTITAKNPISGKIAECKVQVVDSVDKPITSVVLDKKEATLQEGSNLTLHATINPSDTTDNKTLTWSSDNEDVATVEDGVVTAKSEGTAIITVKTENDLFDTCKITVSKKEIIIDSVSLDKNSVTLTEGDSDLLHATINPSDTTLDKTLTWKSSNPKSVIVDTNGKITGIALGESDITVTTVNGKEASCHVIVERKSKPIISVSLDKNEITLKKGNTDTLHATINPSDTTEDKTLTWRSKDETIATVTEQGVITAVAQGDTVISVTTANNKTAECVVHVYDTSKDALEKTIERAEQIDESQYTTSSYEAMNQALINAKEVAKKDDATQDEIDKVQETLNNALNNLEERASEEAIENLSDILEKVKALANQYTEEEFAFMQTVIDEGSNLLEEAEENISEKEVITILEKITEAEEGLKLVDAKKEVRFAINDAEAILNGDIDNYDQKMIKILQEEVNEAKKLLDDNSSDIEVLKNATLRIREAIKNLEMVEVDKEFLQVIYDNLKGLENKGFTADTWKTLQESLQYAEGVLENDDATQSNVKSAINHVLDAYSNLKLANDYTALDFEINFAQKVLENAEQYYETTINDVKTALEKAQTIRNGNSSQKEIDDCVKMMRKLRLTIHKKPQ